MSWDAVYRARVIVLVSNHLQNIFSFFAFLVFTLAPTAPIAAGEHSVLGSRFRAAFLSMLTELTDTDTLLTTTHLVHGFTAISICYKVL